VPNTWGLSRKHIFDACHTALRRLGTQYLDLYFCHRFDRDVPLEETVRAMGDLISQGKVLYWGTSEWSAPQIIEARSVAASLGIPLPITEQPKYNLLHRDRVEIEYARLFELGMGAMVWSPLASGLLSGRYDHGFPTDGRLSRKEYAWVLERALRGNVEKGMNDVRRVSEFAIELGVSPAQLALAWSIRHPQVSTAITGVSRVDQFTDSVECLRVLPLLTDEVLERIDAALGNKPSVPIEA
jgi:aryl-alcohol dehydrogenase-like predicted oxidoreductase